MARLHPIRRPLRDPYGERDSIRPPKRQLENYFLVRGRVYTALLTSTGGRLLVLGRRMMSSRRVDALRLLGSFELRAYTEEADTGRCQNDRDCGCEF
jgi:hypothetical protein